MKRKLKVLIVTKPWQGGLFEYYFNAFKRHNNVEPHICFTYPKSSLEYINYKFNKKRWLNNLIKRINDFKYDLGFFINTFSGIEKLENINNILYLTDDASIEKSKKYLFKNIYLSDVGYAKNFFGNKNFLGELPFGFDPYIHMSIGRSPRAKLIQTIANYDQNRTKWLNLMGENNCFPDVYGNYFTKSNYHFSYPFKIYPSVNYRNQSKVYSKYLISLNIHAKVIKNGTNMKTFEASGFKVPQIINYTPGLENFFEPKKEILIFSNINEYKENLNLLKKDSNIRKRLINNSFKRANAFHTYDNRVNLIMKNFWLS